MAGNRRHPDRNIMVKVNRREDITNRFSQVPNALARGGADDELKLDYTDLSSAERLLLIAGLSCRDEFECTLDVIDSWIADFGRDKREAARRGLREKGYMTMTQRRIERGEEGAGDFAFWEITFYMDPLPPEQRDELKPKTEKTRRKRPIYTPVADQPAAESKPAGNGEPWHPGQASEDGASDRTAGTGEPWHPGQADEAGPQPWQSVPGIQGSLPYIEKDQEKNTPPYPPADLDASGSDDRREGEDSSKDKTNPTVAEAVAWFTRQRTAAALARQYPNWRPPVVSKALQEAVSAGFGDVQTCLRALVAIAEGRHGQTGSARRLLEAGPWWSDSAPPPAAAAPAGPPCPEPGHRGQQADGCKLCAIAAKVREPEPVPAVPAAPPQRSAANEAAYQIAREAGSKTSTTALVGQTA